MKIIMALSVWLLASVMPLTGLTQATRLTYQGQLSVSGAQQASYQMRFRLFDALMGGSPIGSPIEHPAVAVDDGIFSVVLDFGADPNPFTGADRYLEISVRRDAGESYTVLSPRQQISSAPYAIRTLSAQTADMATNAQNLGGVPANQYVTTSSDAFIRNGNTVQTANFNIGGNGYIGGNLGVGNTNPGARLVVSTTTENPGNNTAYFEATEIGPHASNIHFGATGDWYIRSAAVAGKVVLQDTGGNVGIGTSNPNARLTVNGHATQTLAMGGLVKALVNLNSNGTINGCYNGITGSSAGGCGFTAVRNSVGNYTIDLNFQVDGRFVTATPFSLGTDTVSVSVAPVGDLIGVFVKLSASGTSVDKTVFVVVH